MVVSYTAATVTPFGRRQRVSRIFAPTSRRPVPLNDPWLHRALCDGARTRRGYRVLGNGVEPARWRGVRHRRSGGAAFGYQLQPAGLAPRPNHTIERRATVHVRGLLGARGGAGDFGELPHSHRSRRGAAAD